MPIAISLLPQLETPTAIHQGLSPLHKPNFISRCSSSAWLLSSRPQRTVALHGNWKSYSIQAISTEAVKTITDETLIKRSDFPRDFFFGTASSAYQYEGAIREGGKGVSLWDQYAHRNPNKIEDGSNGDVALDSYHRYKEHVALMKDMGVNCYRLSIAWTRILPTGKLCDGVNEEGIRYYNNLINELLSNGIEPFITLYHWDIPQVLEDEYGGFMNSRVINDFRDYVDVCFARFGDRVKHWITLNEPFIYTRGGYINGDSAPGYVENSANNPYVVAHNLLLAHAAAVDLYRMKYQAIQGGEIGITLYADHMIPVNNDKDNRDAAVRALDFSFGWFMDPIHCGDYPESMKHLVRDRLPKFTPEEARLVKGSYDFIGLNYYTANFVASAPASPTPGYNTDGCYTMSTRLEGVPVGAPCGSDWLFIRPDGLQQLLLGIKEKYNNPVVYITENGISNHSSETVDQKINDNLRVQSLKDHLINIQSVVNAGAKVKGYIVWTLLDALEWSFGFTVSFGIHYVDYNDNLKIYPKNSAVWYKEFLGM